MAEDDEIAEMSGELPDGAGNPRVSEYTPEVARLDVLIDRVSELVGITIQAAGGKAPRIKPVKRPETAYARAAKRRSMDRVSSLIAEVEASQQRQLMT